MQRSINRQAWLRSRPNGIPQAHDFDVRGAGMLEVLHPKAGETVVSTAAGGVGSAAGQIANIKGCRVVGVTGGPEKVRQCLDEFGGDPAIDYKATRDLDAALANECPNGIASRVPPGSIEKLDSERGHRPPKPPGRRIRFHHTHHI